MAAQPDTVLLEYERAGNKMKITARLDNEPVFIDNIDPSNASHRQRFIKGLETKVPQAKSEMIDAELLRLADTMSTSPPGGAMVAELDWRNIVRPELFFRPEVSGLTVPVVLEMDGKPVGKWMSCLRWSDGRRDYRPLAQCLDLPAGLKLWFNPIPGDPSMSAPSGWSSRARQKWLDSEAAPDPAELFKQICQRIAHFIDLPRDVAAGTTTLLALWTVLSYGCQAWGAVPYLYVGGPLGSGKSRVFEILARLVFRPLATSNLTGPVLFRTLHDRGGTVLYDEAERLRQSTPDQQEILSMFLAGYKRGGQATRLEAVGDSFRPVTFDVYGPKALACIGGLPATLASRCIPVSMFRSDPSSSKPRNRIDADPEQWQKLRDDLHALALEYGAAWLQLAKRNDVCPRGVNSRNFELWQPILALASWVEEHGANGLLQLMQEHALATVDAGKEDATPEADETLLEILAEFVKRGQSPTAGELLQKAKERDPGTFDRKQAPWIARTVSSRLKNYGLSSPKKSHGERRYREVTVAELQRIQRNYGIDLGLPANDPTPTPEYRPSSPPIDPGPGGARITNNAGL